MLRVRESVLFVLASFLVGIAVYGDALIGRSILAPLDIGPDVFEHYQFMDPEADGIPDNHYISDQFVYDLPLQKVIYDSYHEGEIPWWDPYTYGGRPLLADAHINGTDPVRLLCYAFLPFELAYNWNYLLRGVLTGLGMFLLLRFLEVRFSFAAVLSLSYSYAGWFFLFFGHPWIAGSFLYYPYLWLVWMRLSDSNARLAIILGGLLCGGVFFAGNLQSHLYLPTFAGLLLLGKWWATRKVPYALITVISLSGFIGALLASVVLWNQLEFFVLSERPSTSVFSYPSGLLNGLFLSASVFPWATGTFRTISLGSLAGSSWVGYVLFAGSVVSLVGLVAFVRLRCSEKANSEAAAAARVILGFFFLMSLTPLLNLYYHRSGALGGMAVVILAGLMLEKLCDSALRTKLWKTLGWGFALIFIGLQVAAFVVYPRFQGKISEIMGKVDEPKPGKIVMPELRKFQVDNFSNEVSVLNLETVLSAISIGLFLWLLNRCKNRAVSERALLAILCLSMLPLLSYYSRFRPKHDVSMWQKLVEGGPSQEIVQETAEGGLRYDEEPKANQMVLPFAYPAFYQVNAVRGYSALQPETIVNVRKKSDIPLEWQADLLGESEENKSFNLRVISKGARFRDGKIGEASQVKIVNQKLNELEIEVGKKDSSIIRTDTFYPGWEVIDAKSTGTPVSEYSHSFSKIDAVEDAVLLRYRPTSLAYAPFLTICGLFVITALGGSLLVSRPKTSSVGVS